MANEQIKQSFKNIANAIRSKTGENGTMTAEDMPAKIESIETGIEPSGSLDITENGDGIDVTQYAAVNVNVPTYPEPSGTIHIYNYNIGRTVDVKNYATAAIDIEIPPAKIGSDQILGFDFMRKLAKDGRGGDGVYSIIQQYDDELDGSFYTPWEEYHELDLHPLSGGYDEGELSPWRHDAGFVVAGIYPDTYDENHNFSIHIDGVYTAYSGSYTEEELEQAWQEKFWQQSFPVYDLTGRRIGTLNSVSYCHIELRSDS